MNGLGVVPVWSGSLVVTESRWKTAGQRFPVRKRSTSLPSADRVLGWAAALSRLWAHQRRRSAPNGVRLRKPKRKHATS